MRGQHRTDRPGGRPRTGPVKRSPRSTRHSRRPGGVQQSEGVADRDLAARPARRGLTDLPLRPHVNALSRHEFATVQTTSIDQAAKTVSPLALCRLADAIRHKPRGARSTAQRPPLFALVATAGEDGLEASDLASPPNGARSPLEADGDSGYTNWARSAEAPPGASQARRGVL